MKMIDRWHQTFVTIILVISAFILLSAPLVAQEIHALLILRDDDVKIFNSVEINERYMKNMLRQLNVKADAMKVLADERNYYTADVINWIENRNVQPNDTIFIYFNGHGYVDGNEHFLKINDSRPTPRRYLTDSLSKQNCRLKMLITDTCSSDLIIEKKDENLSTKIESKPRSQQQHYLQHLFYKHEGMLDITAASPGQDAWSNNILGGYFTNALSASIGSDADKDRDRFVSWQEVFELAQFETNEHFSQTDFTGIKDRDSNPITQTQQTPTNSSLPRPMRDGTAPPVAPPDPDDRQPVVPPKSSTAMLNITSTPSGASIIVDGKIIGITPIQEYKIDIGTDLTKRVKVSLALSGYQDIERFITLKNGKAETLNVALKRTTQAPDGVQTTKMVLIPAGDFMMGTEEIDGGETIPVHRVFLNDYLIDEHEVTVGQYREFIEKTGHREPPWKTVKKYSPTENHPMVGVSWHDAMAYALWVGKRLPTEAEWEKAARGGHVGKDYPWGTDEITPKFAHYKLKDDDNPIKHSLPVKSYDPNDFGIYDMAGNVAEWCLDEWDATFYYRSPANNPIAGSRNIEQLIAKYKDIEGRRVIRGGSFTHGKVVCEVGARSKDESKETFANIGFRCVKEVSP